MTGREIVPQKKISRYYGVSRLTITKNYKNLAEKLGIKIVLCRSHPFIEKCPY